MDEEAIMKALIVPVLAIFVGACATMQAGRSEVSILVDLDPASTDRTVIVESITADREGRLYLPDRVSGNVLRVDPKSPKPVVVGRIEAREIKGKKVNADGGGIAFNQQGDLFIASSPFAEVVRIRAADLNVAKPGPAQTFATGTEGANGIVFDKQGNLFVSGGRSGIVYRVGPNGGVAQPAVKLEPYTRKLPDGKTEQAAVANGLDFDAKGILYVADTARGAIWKIEMQTDGKGSKPMLFAQSPLLEGVDGTALDADGKLWAAVNERNAIVTVTRDGNVQEVAKNGSAGPLEFPSAIVFVGNMAYISNYDTPRRDNMDANGQTARDGIGASIAQITR
jgi:sugar lactone lactonase YvrE